MNDYTDIIKIADKIINKSKIKEIKCILPDGSRRQFYRIICSHESYILMYDPEPGRGNNTDENRTYLYIQSIFASNGIKVPKIIGTAKDYKIIIMEDLGDMKLQKYFKSNGYNEDIIDMIITNIITIGNIQKFDNNQIFSNKYDEDFVYQQEAMYFFEHFISRFLKFDQEYFERIKKSLHILSRKIGEFKYKGFMHRDLQSRNIMIYESVPYYIDFQGAREGHRAYDLASFIFDAYTNLYPEKYDYLINLIIDKLHREKTNIQHFLYEFKYIAVFRLMQMLGAFCNLFYNKEKSYFGQFIKKTKNNLWHHLATIEDDEAFFLRSILKDIRII